MMNGLVHDIENILDFHTLFLTIAVIIGLRYIMRENDEIVLQKRI